MVASAAPSPESSPAFAEASPSLRVLRPVEAAVARPVARVLRRILAGLHGAIGVAAIGGGVLLVAEPSGAALDLTTSVLSGFTSFLIPGALLIGLGVLQMGAAVWTVRPGSAGLVASQMGGGLLVLWIAFESALIGPIHPLQVAGMLIGAFIFMLAHELHHDEPHKHLLP